jgi:hypothetical protein
VSDADELYNNMVVTDAGYVYAVAFSHTGINDVPTAL